MDNSVKITNLQIENVKRVSAVEFDLTTNGLTLIGGSNAQGKTTILDSIAFALGGEKYKPSNLQRDGSHADAHIKLTLSNGLIVERKGKKASLKITDPTNARSGQALLNSFIEELAINLPKFLNMTNDKKVAELLNIIGVEKELEAIDIEEKIATDKRYDCKKDHARLEAYATELLYYDDAPDKLVNAAELLKQSGEILKRNEENQQKRNNLSTLQSQKDNYDQTVIRLKYAFIEAERNLKDATAEQLILNDNLLTAQKTTEALQDESTTELQEKINNIDDINAKVRSNMDKEKAEDDTAQSLELVAKAEIKVSSVRDKRKLLFDGAKLPLTGLTIGKDFTEKNVIMFNGKAWDCMSGMEQIKVATAIVKSLNPKCGFILLDKLEAFDNNNLKELKTWLEAENLQAIGTRVGTDGDCSIIIEDGAIKEQIKIEQPKKEIESWV